ncbi:MAG: pseudouridine synthase [Eubacteriales bacterium]|nr:pseudouridine synthase [Eubacteriales bacterium]
MRLDKYLADAGIGTRSEVKKLIYWKKVTVNGETVDDPAYRLSETSLVCFKGEPVQYSEFEYWMLNKPSGVVSESRKNSLKRGEKIPEGKEKTVVDLIRGSGKKDLFPAGRLDKDTEGLLLITNDGKLAHRLLSPAKHVEKTYYAELSGPLSKEAAERLEAGADIGDETPTRPCRIDRIGQDAVHITITEGRYHQIKRMFETEGLTVTYLRRITFGPLSLDETLLPGESRQLTGEEISLLTEEKRNGK